MDSFEMAVSLERIQMDFVRDIALVRAADSFHIRPYLRLPMVALEMSLANYLIRAMEPMPVLVSFSLILLRPIE
jgi:hypothetical protein